MRVLVVEDGLGMRAFLTRFLTKEGWEVVAVTDGCEALGAFEVGRFRLAVMDIGLGKGPDGMEVARKLREMEPVLRFIMISGDPANEAKVREAKLGPFLAKPFDIGEFKSILACLNIPV